MLRAFPIDRSDAEPIWSQIEEGMRRLVALGTLAPGSPVPSVRELARRLRVNPATVAKAYRRLEDAGLLRARRGSGTTVAASPPAMTRAERRHTLRRGADRYASVAITVGAGRGEAAGALVSAWRRLSRR